MANAPPTPTRTAHAPRTDDRGAAGRAGSDARHEVDTDSENPAPVAAGAPTTASDLARSARARTIGRSDRAVGQLAASVGVGQGRRR